MHRIAFGIVFGFTLAGSLAPGQQQPAQQQAAAQIDAHPAWFGQIDDRQPEHPRLGYPGSGFEFRFRGTGAQLRITSTSDQSALTLVVDHGSPETRVLSKGPNSVDLLKDAENLTHTVVVVKRTETWQGILTVDGIALAPESEAMPAPPLPSRRLIFLGDSVTCGAGIDNNATCKNDREHPASNGFESYGMLLGRRLDADTHLTCYGGRGLERDYRGLAIADNVVNAPDFYNLAIASDDPPGRVPWDTARWQPDAVFVSIGTNDFNLQGKKPLDQKKWVSEYVAFAQSLRRAYPHALILLTEGAIVTDPLLKQMVQQAAAATLDTRVIYTPSTHYPGNGCDGHPTRAHHVRMADDFEPVLRRLLGW